MTARSLPILVSLLLLPLPSVGQQTAKVRRYLEQIHHQLAPGWAEVQQLAAERYPAGHAVNDKTLWAEVALRLDDAPGGLSLSRGSGNHLFDNSALRVMSWARRKMGPLPGGMPEGDAVLSWRFFRDGRGCEPGHARLVVRPHSPQRLLARALLRKDWRRARQIVQRHRADRRLKRLLGDAGLSCDDPQIQVLSLEIASSARIEAALASTPRLWTDGLRVLEQRRAAAVLTRMLSREAQPPASWRKAAPPINIPHVLQLMAVLDRIEAPLPGEVALRLVAHPRVEVASEVISVSRDRAVLDAAKKAWSAHPGMTGVVAVRRCALQDREAVGAVRKALAGKGRSLTLAALERFPLGDLAPDVANLVRDARTPPAQRVRAIRVLAKMPGFPLVPLYLALRAAQPQVQIAALEVLGRVQANKKAVTYRVAELGYRASGPVGTAALAAQARLGYEPFQSDVIRLMKRLSVRQRAQVVASLWGYGDVLVPTLKGMAEHGEPLIRAAALSSLERIQTEEARKALSVVKRGPGTRSAGQRPVDAAQQTDLLHLIRLATSASPSPGS